ncbi:hypothetical protein AFLA_001152 [Aspergillus flavus NRRL3357]|nr:hypothetical protein AFLA_001152 [Aspergillus flavus NRRL3357]
MQSRMEYCRTPYLESTYQSEAVTPVLEQVDQKREREKGVTRLEPSRWVFLKGKIKNVSLRVSGKIQGLGTCLFSVMENPIEFHYSKIQLSSDERDYLRGDNARVTGGMMTKIDDLSRSSSV